MTALANRDRPQHRWLLLSGLASLVTAALWACGTEGSDIPASNQFAGSGGTSGSSAQSGSGGSSGSNQSGSSGNSGTGASIAGAAGTPDGGGDAIEEGCAAVDASATRFPLSLILLLDQSSSMDGAKWTGATQAVLDFAKSPASADINVALNLFPREPPPVPICSTEGYRTPSVDFAKLTGQASDPQVAAFQAAMPASPPGVGTPIYTALGGSLERLKAIADLVPAGKKETFAVLLITDGAPASPPGSADCSAFNPLSTDDIAARAKVFYDMVGIRTYVIGMQGVPGSFGNAVAAAGGTDAMIPIQNGDVAASLTAALAAIRGDSLGCEYQLPPQINTEYDPNVVNVYYSPGGENPGVIGKKAGCSSGVGWRYDDEISPTKIILCPDSCTTVKNDPLAVVNIRMGCPTEIIE